VIDLVTLLERLDADGDCYRITASDDWLQGRTAYGGLTAAICVEAALRRYPDLPPLKSAQFTFVGPATGELTARPDVLRQGKSTSFVNVDLGGASGLATRATLCFGSARTSTINHVMSAAPPSADCRSGPPFFKERLAIFTQHFEVRQAGGALPFEQSSDPVYRVWSRHEGAAPPTIVGLLALADVLPPAAYVLSKQFAPLSTVSWMIDVLTDTLETTDGWWMVEARAEHAVDGYSSQAMTIWNAGGKAVALARQNIAIFA
jgi:acyl-CoA thioesterase